MGNNIELQNKVAVITGASDGIGKEISLRLAKEKVQLILIARNKERLDELARESSALGSPKALPYCLDLTNASEIPHISERINKDFPVINILINNAGIWHKAQNLELISDEEITQVIATNLTGTILLTKHLLPLLKKADKAAIINICSRSGVTVKEGQSAYAASKWGMTSFTQTLKLDLKGSNIRVAGVYQGGCKTDIFKKAGDDRDTSNYIDPKDLAEVIIFMLNRPKNIWLQDVHIEY